MAAKQRKIYFARAGETDRIKIGSAVDVEDRIKILQTGCPERLNVLLVLPCGSYEMESGFHRQFGSSRTQGEWFKYEPEVASFIRRRLEGRRILEEAEFEYVSAKRQELREKIAEDEYDRKQEEEYERRIDSEMADYYSNKGDRDASESS